MRKPVLILNLSEVQKPCSAFLSKIWSCKTESSSLSKFEHSTRKPVSEPVFEDRLPRPGRSCSTLAVEQQLVTVQDSADKSLLARNLLNDNLKLILTPFPRVNPTWRLVQNFVRR